MGAVTVEEVPPTMAAYIIADVTVTDPAAFEAYRREVPPSIERAGGRYLVRGGRFEVLEGDYRPSRVVVLEFPSMEAARRWYDSEEYAHLRAMRERAADSRVILVEGV
jgi:uncharacterized protein (DUF1330 family)